MDLLRNIELRVHLISIRKISSFEFFGLSLNPFSTCTNQQILEEFRKF